MKEKKSSPNFQYTRACIVDTIYSLFIYLLISNKEETEHTFFFFSDGIAHVAGLFIGKNGGHPFPLLS